MNGKRSSFLGIIHVHTMDKHSLCGPYAGNPRNQSSGFIVIVACPGEGLSVV